MECVKGGKLINNQKNEDQEDSSYELPSIQSSELLIGNIHKAAIISEVESNENIKDKFIKQAQKSVSNELFSINQENTVRKQKVSYDANVEACRIYGINNHVPLWQINLMKIGSSFWFIIYFIFATITIAPINVFFSGIKHFIKKNYVVFIFAIVCYLLVVIGLPLLISSL